MQTTVLVVDDEPAILDLISAALGAAGYTVLKARNSDHALDISAAQVEDIHLLVTDVKMDPAMTGYQLAQCLRLMRVELKVLYISGHVEDEMVRWEVENGLADFLQKPFLPSDLVARVAGILATASR